MNSDVLIEVVGYAASGLIVLSIIQKSILKLRLLGLMGSLTFLVYSVVIGAYPIAVVNVIATGIHGWYLRQLLSRKDEVFRILHVRAEAKYLLDFLDFYRDEIKSLCLDFDYEPSDDLVTAFILRDMVPAGLFIGRAGDDGTFEVILDFVIPQYRDFKIGTYVYSPDSELFAGIEPTCVRAVASSDAHADYFRRMGFSPRPNWPRDFEIQIAATASS